MSADKKAVLAALLAMVSIVFGGGYALRLHDQVVASGNRATKAEVENQALEAEVEKLRAENREFRRVTGNLVIATSPYAEDITRDAAEVSNLAAFGPEVLESLGRVRLKILK